MRKIFWYLLISSFIHQGRMNCNNTWSGLSGKWKTPNFSKTYDSHLDCFLHIITPPGTRVLITVPVFELEGKWNTQTLKPIVCPDYLKIIDKCNDKELANRCGITPPFQIPSETNKVTIHYHSNNANIKKLKGVKIKWKGIPTESPYQYEMKTVYRKLLRTKQTLLKMVSPSPAIPEPTRQHQISLLGSKRPHQSTKLESTVLHQTTLAETRRHYQTAMTKSTGLHYTTIQDSVTLYRNNHHSMPLYKSPKYTAHNEKTYMTYASERSTIIAQTNNTIHKPNGETLLVIVIASVSILEVIIIVAGCLQWRKRREENRIFGMQKRVREASNPHGFCLNPREISSDRNSHSESENVYNEIEIGDKMPIMASKKFIEENCYASPFEEGQIPHVEIHLEMSNDALPKGNCDGYELAKINSTGKECAKSKPQIKPRPKKILAQKHKCPGHNNGLVNDNKSGGLNSQHNKQADQNGGYELAEVAYGPRPNCTNECPYRESMPPEGEYDTLHQKRERKNFLEESGIYGVVRD